MQALIKAIIEENLPKARRLLKADAALAACLFDKQMLFEEINHWIYVGDTALHLAAAGYRVEIAQLLLTSGADPNSTHNHRQSGPLHYAADGFINHPSWNAERQVQTIQCLLDAGADIKVQDKNGATPLHRAVRTRCTSAVACLLNAGSDPAMKNKSGSTPFHLAVQNTGRGGTGAEEAKDAQRQIIEQFLTFGVKATLKDNKGKSVIDCAKSDWIRKLLV